MTKKGSEAGGKYGRLTRFGNKSNSAPDGYRAYQGTARAWCYLCNRVHTKAEHDELMEKR